MRIELSEYISYLHFGQIYESLTFASARHKKDHFKSIFNVNRSEGSPQTLCQVLHMRTCMII